jgi:hypothetical protein
MNLAQVRIIQAFADLAIPLLGYFFWNWDFYFILLFYLLDYKIFCVFSFVKFQKVIQYKGLEKKFPVVKLLLTIALILIGFVAVIPALYQIDSAFDLLKNTWEFLSYKEMGIAQGIILIPLLIYAGFAQYKMQFLLSGKFQTTKPSEIWELHFQTMFLVIAASGLFLGLSLLSEIPVVFYVFSLIFGVSAYRFFIARHV